MVASAIFCLLCTVAFSCLHQRQCSHQIHRDGKCFALSFQTGVKNEYSDKVKRREQSLQTLSLSYATHGFCHLLLKRGEEREKKQLSCLFSCRLIYQPAAVWMKSDCATDEKAHSQGPSPLYAYLCLTAL